MAKCKDLTGLAVKGLRWLASQSLMELELLLGETLATSLVWMMK